MTPTVVTSKEELVDLIRTRIAELELTHSTVDGIAGLQDGYCSKLVAPKPIKGLGRMSTDALLGALALGIACVVIVEDIEQTERVAGRWVKRERPRRRLSAS